MTTETVIQLAIGLCLTVTGFILVTLISIIGFFLKQIMGQVKTMTDNQNKQEVAAVNFRSRINNLQDQIESFKQFMIESISDRSNLRQTMAENIEKFNQRTDASHSKIMAEISSCNQSIARIETTLKIKTK